MYWSFYYSFFTFESSLSNKKHLTTKTMAAAQGQYDWEMAKLVYQIVDFPEGSPCFLCQMMEGRECVWDEVGPELTMEGRNTIIWHEASEGAFMWHPTIAKSHHAAHYACYWCYIYTASTWTPGAGWVQIPTCVETNICQLFPGDGVFVGFNDGAAPGDDNDGVAKAAIHAAVHECGAAVHEN